METLKNATKQDIKLIEGNFSPSEATDIINAVLDVKINFHKLQRLSKTEGDTNDSCCFDNDRIDELLAAKQQVKKLFNSIRENGGKISINSSITINTEQ